MTADVFRASLAWFYIHFSGAELLGHQGAHFELLEGWFAVSLPGIFVLASSP